MDPIVATSQRAVAWLLITGGMLAVVGAFWPPYRQWSAPLPEALRVIASHPIGWRCIHAGFGSGTIVSMLGLAALASALRGRPGGEQALLVAVAYGVGGTLWLVNIAIRLSATPWAAHELVATGSIPPTYMVWRSFNGVLFAAFSAIAYACVAGLGWVVTLTCVFRGLFLYALHRRGRWVRTTL